jgi:23S rRNA (uridine2552-2'-O)-methyltransferase
MVKKSSSRQWLREHFSDVYVKKAQQEGYRSRAVYKLLELQEKDKLFKPGMVVVDLGAAPGGWSQIIVKAVGSKGRVIAMDILPMEPISGVEFIQGDFTEDAVFNELLALLGKSHVDWVVSDMAPNISGIDSVDQPRSMLLAELAYDFALQVLDKNGGLLMKVFQGEGFDNFLKQIKQSFKKVIIRKPKASRGRSSEVYILASLRK